MWSDSEGWRDIVWRQLIKLDFPIWPMVMKMSPFLNLPEGIVEHEIAGSVASHCRHNIVEGDSRGPLLYNPPSSSSTSSSRKSERPKCDPTTHVFIKNLVQYLRWGHLWYKTSKFGHKVSVASNVRVVMVHRNTMTWRIQTECLFSRPGTHESLSWHKFSMFAEFVLISVITR